MKETYSYEFNWWQKILQKTLGMWRINRDSIDFKWGYFAPRWGLEFVLHRGGYFDPHYAIAFTLGWGHFHIKLPFKTRLGEGCSLPRYGFQFYEDVLWIHKGGVYDKSLGQVTRDGSWTFYLPFKHWEFQGHWILDKNCAWREMSRRYKDDLPNSWDFRESDECLREVFDYTYVLNSGEVQKRKATCSIEKRKWSRKWFPKSVKEIRTMDVKFDDEVGERTGSWKGGIIGTGHEMLEGETMKQCIRRMERERKFT